MLKKLLEFVTYFATLLLPCALLLVVYITFTCYAEDKKKEERRKRREKVLRNTKEEAIKQARGPVTRGEWLLQTTILFGQLDSSDWTRATELYHLSNQNISLH